MSEPFAAFELITRLSGKVEADVIQDTLAVKQRVLAQRNARGVVLSKATLSELGNAMQRLIEDREQTLLGAARKALKTKPPDTGDEATVASIVNFLMADLGRYYGHGSIHLRNVAKIIGYSDGLPPTLRDQEDKLRRRLTASVEIMLRELEMERAEGKQAQDAAQNKPDPRHVFVVHGRNEEHRTAVACAIGSFGLTPIVLHEQPNRGRTIIEKFEDHSNVGFAVVILSGDDVGRLRSEASDDLRPRPRQNVIL